MTDRVRALLVAPDHDLLIIKRMRPGSDRTPTLQDADTETTSGCGLMLVGAVSSERGYYTPEGSTGKVVWALATE